MSCCDFGDFMVAVCIECYIGKLSPRVVVGNKCAFVTVLVDIKGTTAELGGEYDHKRGHHAVIFFSVLVRGEKLPFFV